MVHVLVLTLLYGQLMKTQIHNYNTFYYKKNYYEKGIKDEGNFLIDDYEVYQIIKKIET